MFILKKTKLFRDWMNDLADLKVKHLITVRLTRLEMGLMGDVKPIGKGLSELRIDYGTGFRVYFMKRDKEIIILLTGGDKKTQQQDISKAHDMADYIKKGNNDE